jgi:hypothetical protein
MPGFLLNSSSNLAMTTLSCMKSTGSWVPSQSAEMLTPPMVMASHALNSNPISVVDCRAAILPSASTFAVA